ncbi:uncharacterized protein SPPG_00271 [Spizellomyces punctatus DAOM BR117]|uniref:N-acetyltransferase domain-containing protein n=1 Tax=Spizellomyces punctatus (strain DAOM BR117) TaxID=645134 RepID=A0A0L0HT68_SPIPD|nr:uncharacterized protein SPPG_00271 [Spizellomyces punctatus DAOM BR117]KND04546.1 hypothetical protein SPPG_00271 [Spizellomyces punctatus DAOM BR117]|eukprot:XP_016612585.1 hypothetical protein SPPG_00271 [Spizellomyces punctatus DAOM BR117]
MQSEEPKFVVQPFHNWNGSCTLFEPVQLEGPRLRLTPTTADDLPELYSLSHNQGQNVFEHFPWGPFESVEEFERFHLGPKLLGSPNAMMFTVWLLPHGDNKNEELKRIGVFGYINIVPQHKNIEIGPVWLNPGTHGAGFATEAGYLLIRHAFENLQYVHVEWRAHHLNVASRQCAASIGFQQDGYLRKHMLLHGQWRHTVILTITDDDWKEGVKDRLEVKLLAKLRN